MFGAFLLLPVDGYRDGELTVDAAQCGETVVFFTWVN